jgi:DNA-binding MarR family transcriptional regulator
LLDIKALVTLRGVTETVTHIAHAAAPRLTYLIKRIEMVERARMEEVLRPLGVSLHQYTALSILERGGGLSSAQLARRHFVTPQAANLLVGLLERIGLIERRADPMNRKILRAWLTDEGRRVLKLCHLAVDDLETQMLGAFTPDQAKQFRWSLERTLTALIEISA